MMTPATRVFEPKRAVTCLGRANGLSRNPSCFAIAQLELIPRSDSGDMEVVDSEVAIVDQKGTAYTRAECKYFVSGALKGIEDVLNHYRSLGIEIGGGVVVIRKLVVHDVDSTESAFRIASRHAMASCVVSTGSSA